MSTGRRAYNLLRGYVHREWERIKDIDREQAEAELQDALDSPAPIPPKRDTSAARPGTSEPLDLEDKAHARRVLGVAENAGFEDIRRAFERLNRRSDPANFPENSPEAREAADIQRRVHWAYDLLTEGMDATERRFRSLGL
jgi:hypothetical protein